MFNEVLGPLAEVIYLGDTDPRERGAMLAGADALICLRLTSELHGEAEFAQLGSLRLLQSLSAGVEHLPFDRIPEHVMVASNAGAYGRSGAEHALAMALALLKRLPQNHAALARGEFPHDAVTRGFGETRVGVLGLGGIGRACARLFSGLGMRVEGIGRTGTADSHVERLGALADLERTLRSVDIVVIALPLTRETAGLIGARELSLMKPDAILINVARAGITDEDALYAHLVANPSFSAGIDVWWDEPSGDVAFAPRHPFMELENVIGSPHNSGHTPDWSEAGARQAAQNVARLLRGESPAHLVDRSEYAAVS